MKKKIEALLKRLQIAVRHNPAEVVLSVLFCCFGCALYETSWARLAVVVYYFPVLFLITCTLNSMTEGSRWRFAIICLCCSLFRFSGRRKISGLFSIG